MKSFKKFAALALATISSTTVFGASVKFEEAADIAVKSAARIVVVGEDHADAKFAGSVGSYLAALRSKANFDCLFIESPNDLQPAFDRSLADGNFKSFARAISVAYVAGYQRFFQKAGVQCPETEAFVRGLQNAETLPGNFAVNAGLFAQLRQSNIRLFAYDSNSRSPQYFDSIQTIASYQMRTRIPGARPDLEVFADRNATIAANIANNMKSCANAVVVVGFGHLQNFKSVKESADRQPVQVLLKNAGFSSAVFIHIARARSGQESNFSAMYPDYLGMTTHP